MAVKVNKFPSDAEAGRITVLRKYQKLYENKAFAVLGLHELIKKQYAKQKDIVYLAHAIPARISDFYGDFVQGETDELLIQSPVEDTKITDYIEDVVFINDLKERISDLGSEQSEFGFVVLHVRKDEEDKIRIETVPQDQYFPQADKSVIIATYKRDMSVTITEKWFLWTRHYQLEDEKVKVENQAWDANSQGKATNEIELATIAPMFGREKIEKVETIELDELPFRQIDNGRKHTTGYGKSDYFDIMPQLAELNERGTHASTQLLKNLDAKMILPKVPELVDDDGKIKPFDTLMIEGKDNADAKYIVNANPLLEANREHMLDQIRVISLISAVPMFELLKSAMPERVESLKIQLFGAERRTTTKRAKISRGLKDILRMGAKLSGIELDEDPIVKFGSVLPIDLLEQANVENIKVTTGISSKKSAMKRIIFASRFFSNCVDA